MKFKTFKSIVLAAVSIYLMGYPVIEDEIINWLFYKNGPMWLDFFEFSGIIRTVIIILALLYFLKSTFNISNQSTMTKKAYCLYTVFFILVMALPFLFYPSRTEVTAEAITKHNLIGQVSQVYHIDDAEKITVYLKPYSSARKNRLQRTYLTFSYEIEYSNGNVYYLESKDDDMWWDVVSSIDSKASEIGIKKEVFGKSYCDMISDFDNFSEFIYRKDIIRKILEI